MKTFKTIIQEAKVLVEKSLQFDNDAHDNYAHSGFEYDGKDHEIMMRGSDSKWSVLFTWYDEEQDDPDVELYDKTHKNYKDMVKKFGAFLKKYTKNKWDLRKMPKEGELELIPGKNQIKFGN